MADHAITRRRLVQAGAATAAGAGMAQVPAAGAATQRRRTRRTDVVVIGAGIAGMTAALELVKAGQRVIVLEARNRVGGRVVNLDIGDGEISERGGTFAGPTQDHILALASDLGVATFPSYNEGQNVYVADDGSRMTYSDTSPLGTAPPDPLIAGDIAQAITRLNEMSLEVPVDRPWESPNAVEWDQQSMETWVRDNSASPRFRKIVPAATRPIFGAEPRELSLLFVLFYIAASGNEQNPGTFDRNFNTRDGAQMFRFVGGSGRITEELARRLGRRVLLSSPVRRITQRSSEVTAWCDKLVVKARKAIVAMPPALAGRIDYGPILPPSRDALMQRLAQGTLIKIHVTYDSAFWRGDGLNGTGVSLQGPVNVTYDDSPDDGTPGVIIGFVGGDEARSFVTKSPAERRAAVLDNLAVNFGPRARDARDYYESDWPAERWSRGGPVGIGPPGVLLSYGPAIRQPFVNLHFAGTETSTYWTGYMDGAVRSAKRVVAEVLEAL